MKYGCAILALLAVAVTPAEAAKRKPVFKASCATPATPLPDGTGSGTLRIARGAGSVKIASVKLAPGQAASTTAFSLSRSSAGFTFKAKPLDGITRTVRHHVKVSVRFVRTGGRVVTKVVTCTVAVRHTQAQPAPPDNRPPTTLPLPPAPPPPPDPPPPPPPPPVTTDYVALGDSAASGVGTGTYFEPTCRRSDLSYPRLIDTGRPNTDLVFAACAATTIQSVRDNQLGSLGAGTDLVTVTVGANDAGFDTVMGACVAGNDGQCSTAIANANQFIADTLPGRLTTLFGEIRAAAPTATVVVAGYPRLFSGTTCAAAAAPNLSAAEQGQLNASTDAFRDVNKARAEAAGFTFADPIAAFTGHALCAADPWITGVLGPANEAFHPTAAGYESYATLIRAIIG